jgi:electron transfer flavoprotein alpha subunit/transcriptional regulator with XRE-family HTH domain
MRMDESAMDHDQNQIWVVGDLRAPRFFSFGLNILAKARLLAQELSCLTAMVFMDAADLRLSGPACGTITDPLGECLTHGADRAIQLLHPDLGTAQPAVHAAVLSDLISARQPRLVLFALTDWGRETAARVARRLDLGLIADCVDIRLDADERWVAACPSWGGDIMAEIGFADPDRAGLATVDPHAFSATTVPGHRGIIQTSTVTIPPIGPQPVLLSRTPEPDTKRRLEDADIVVAGGAGLGSSAGFDQVRELAAALGAEVGASRPPVLQHWIDAERLIGQTGKRIRARLVFSIGISGAVQYTAGIQEAHLSVAVNRDANAPIFNQADIGIVADAKSFLPLLTAKMRRTVLRRLADNLCEERPPDREAGFGAKVRKLRQDRQWSQAELAEATGQTPEFIATVEADETSPPVSFLLGLARALEVDPDTFLHEQERGIIKDERVKAFVQRTRNYSYQTFTPGAENAHLRAFMVTIEPHQAHKPVAYKHEGEEFIYVLEGELEVTLGGKRHHLKPGETLHFNSEVPHKLKSLSGVPTRCLDVLYTP